MCVKYHGVSNDQKGSRQRTAKVLRNHLQRCSVLGCGAAVLYCSHLLARNTARITLKHRELPVHRKANACLLIVGAIAGGLRSLVGVDRSEHRDGLS